jgi:hypothetical protein
MATKVRDQGFGDNLESYLILLMAALTKAYRTQESPGSGLPEFQKAIQLLSRLGARFTLEFAQTQFFAAIFQLKMGRLIDFWSYLHMGCTILYKVICE